jgi:hypothetical protein
VKAQQPQQNRVIISYSNEDYHEANRLYDDLKKSGANPWLNKEDIIPGHNMEIEIKEAIKNSRYFIALLSSKSVNKIGSSERELKYALETYLNQFKFNRYFDFANKLIAIRIVHRQRFIDYYTLLLMQFLLLMI